MSDGMKIADGYRHLAELEKHMSKFIQISTASETVYALDDDGTVWKYCPAIEETEHASERYAFWTSLTSHQVDSRTGARKK